MKIRNEKKIVTVGNAQGCAFINCTVCPVICAVIDGDNGMGHIERRIPTRDGTVFADEDEYRGLRIPIKSDFEGRSASEYDSRGIPSVLVPRARRNGHDQRTPDGCAGLVIKRRNSRAVVAHPDHRTAGICDHPPWIYEVWIDMGCDPRQIRLEIG